VQRVQDWSPYTCTCWYRACEGEGLHNVGWYI